MGLDAYAYTADLPVGDPGFEAIRSAVEVGDAEVAYWRGCYGLHEWVSNRHIARGGDRDTNGTRIQLLPEDIKELEQQLVEDAMAQPYERDDNLFDAVGGLAPWHVKALKTLFPKAKEAFAAGRHVYYVGNY